MSRFSDDTAVEPSGPGRWSARIDRGWWIERGPNGGYVAAVVLRAIEAELDDPRRRPRSLSLHYLAPPSEGPAIVEVGVERAGRSLTNLSARLVQDDATRVIALAACGADRPAEGWRDLAFGDPPPPDELVTDASPEPGPPMRQLFQYRHLSGQPFSGADRAETSGWLRLADAAPCDAPMVALLTDAWLPAIFTRMDGFAGVPTIDLTVHFREPPAPADAEPGAWFFARFVTRTLSGGYLEEDGEVWSRSGRLLAQSRQLAAMLVPRV